MRRKQLVGKELRWDEVFLVKGNTNISLLRESTGKKESVSPTSLGFEKDSYVFLAQAKTLQKGDVVFFKGKLIKRRDTSSGKVDNILTIGSDSTEVLYAVAKNKIEGPYGSLWTLDPLSFEFPFIQFLNGLALEGLSAEEQELRDFRINLESEKQSFGADTEIDPSNPPSEILFTFAKDVFDDEGKFEKKEGGYI